MRIGQFAKAHNIPLDTIRYYLDIELLVAEKRGGQYYFAETDSKDIEMILRLKGMNFSLSEIQRLLAVQRLSGANTDVFRNIYKTLLEKKKTEIAEELQRYTKLNGYLHETIKDMKDGGSQEIQILGIPFHALNLLACPECGASISVTDGSIIQNMIMDANIYCQCGYVAKISNGAYIDARSVRKKLVNGCPMPTKQEYLEMSTYSYVNFIYKGLTSLSDYIQRHVPMPKVILELDNCVGFFLMQHIENLPSTTLYILVDYDFDRLMDMKRNLEMYQNHTNFLFLCCDLDKLPLKAESVDVAVDYMMSRLYYEASNRLLHDKIKPLLSKDAVYFSSSLFHSQEVQKNKTFDRESILNTYKNAGLTLVETSQIGPAFNCDSMDPNVQNKELFQILIASKP